MPWTLNEIASAIDNDVRSGLKGVVNFPYSIEQLEKEVCAERVKMLKNHKDNNIAFRTNGWAQRIVVKFDTQKLSLDDKAPGPKYTHFKIPALVNALEEDAVEYFGPKTLALDHKRWAIYIGNDFKLHQYRIATGNKPYAYINPAIDKDGFVNGWLFNYTGRVVEAFMDGIFPDIEDAWLLSQEENIDPDSVPFPIPEEYIEELIRRLTNKYLSYYRQGAAPIQSNTQTDISR